jgi:hypothetical protein
MKIDEPKTPYARRYDPSEDEAEIHMLDVGELVVDELDAEDVAAGRPKVRTRESDIPGLELGDPEEAVPVGMQRTGSGSGKEKMVVVDPASKGEGGHGEMEGWSREEVEKHRRFEELRKKHYEMKDVRELLGYVGHPLGSSSASASASTLAFVCFSPALLPTAFCPILHRFFSRMNDLNPLFSSHPEDVDMEDEDDAAARAGLPIHLRGIVNGA